MKASIQISQEVELKTLHIEAGVRYWEDAIVNGQKDEDGTLIPCRKGDSWCPIIDLDSGVILNWTPGVVAKVHYKVCDDGSYYLKDADGKIVMQREGDYVPDIVPGSYGDYIEMKIDGSGKIEEWNKNASLEGFNPADPLAAANALPDVVAALEAIIFHTDPDEGDGSYRYDSAGDACDFAFARASEVLAKLKGGGK